MRLPTFVLLCACLTPVAHAAVYTGDEFLFHQPDGSAFAVRIWGDEFSIVAETPDGWALEKDAAGWWHYASPAAGGGITTSALRVNAGNPAVLGVAKHLRSSHQQRKAVADTRRSKLSRDQRGRPIARTQLTASPALSPASPASPASVTTTGAFGTSATVFAPGHLTVGTRNGVTLLVRFPDRLADATITTQQVDDYCNANNYTGFGNNGSVKQYYLDNSLGRLTYTNTVVDYHTMSQNRTYYAQVTPAPGTDPIQELIIEALEAADANGFDYRTCDGNGDGVIDGVNIFYAGVCPNNWAEGLWPHMSTISWTSNDGMHTGAYQMTDMQSELTLGTFCHENGHMLCGYPDIYDYDYDSTGGAGIFCLMNSGGHGKNPARICGYLALSCGWRDPVDLNGGAAGTRTATAESTSIFRYAKPGSLTEYFLIENRFAGSASHRDAILPCSGLAIWHCDEQGDHNDQRYNSNTQHNNYEVALVQADNLWQFEQYTSDGDSGDLWYLGNPAPTYSGQLDDGPGTNPRANDARWWDGTPSGLNLSSIASPGLSQDFSYGLTALTLSSATYSVTEGSSGTTSAVITVTRTGTMAGTALLNWTATDGTATVAGRDYTASSGTVTWASGVIGDKTFTIPILGDTMAEGDETILITVTCPTVGVQVIRSSATLTVLNDDGVAPAAGSLELTTYTPSITEGTSAGTTTLTIPVRRRGGSTGAVSVPWSISGGTTASGIDYTTTSGVLNWGNGDGADKNILVSIVPDSDPEDDETFTVTLGSASGGAVAPTPNQAVATILNDDVTFQFQLSSVNAMEPKTGSRPALVSVRHSGAIHGTVTVDYRLTGVGTAIANLDYTVIPGGTLTWSDSSIDPVISLPILADSENEATETTGLTLSNPVGGSLGSPATTTVNIRDYAAPSPVGSPGGTASGSGSQGGMCGAGTLAGFLALGGLGLLRRRRR